MSEEIKEILDKLNKTADNPLFVICSSQKELDKIPKYTANFLSVNDRQAKLLLNYITNLQQKVEEKNKEIDRLKDLCNKYEEEHKTAFKLWTQKMEEIPDYEESMKLKKEVVRLNNIINELEKWLIEQDKYLHSIHVFEDYQLTYYAIVLDKLKALKENNK